MKKTTRPIRIESAPRKIEVTNLDITVLAGGPSEEREVSIASGNMVASALAGLGHRVSICDISPDDLSALGRAADIVFIALHGSFGEDGQIQAELERRGIPFTGTGSVGSALCMDKVAAKGCFVAAGLPTPRFDVARSSRIAEVARRWRLPVVVKPVCSGSSVDTHLVRDRSRFLAAMTDVVKKHGQAMVEELIEGPELTVGILGNRALPPIQIDTSRDFYDYQAKYIDEETDYRFDIDLSPKLLAKVQAMSLRAAEAAGCRDFCRVDWMVDRITHEPYLLEINTIPGFTSHSLLPKAAQKEGLSIAQLCQRIVELALVGDND